MLARRKPLKRSTKPIRRSEPPRRKKPLSRATKAIRRLKPVKRVGAKARRRAPWMARCREAAFFRAAVVLTPAGPAYVRCEECSRTIGADEAEWHHAFGRSLGVAGKSRWCHVKELTAVLCRACHESVTNPSTPAEHSMRERVRAYAALRLAARLGVSRPAAVLAVATTSARALVVHMVEAAGGQPSEP